MIHSVLIVLEASAYIIAISYCQGNVEWILGITDDVFFCYIN